MLLSFSPSVRRFLSQQQLYLAIAAAVYVVFWTMNLTSNVVTVLIYSVLLGNCATMIVESVMRLCGKRSLRQQWLVFAASLPFATAIAVTLATCVVYWVVPSPRGPFLPFLVSGWKFPSVVTVIVGTVLFLYRSTKEGLEKDKLELQHSVEFEAAQRELQEQELQRAREIQQSLLPKEIPEVFGFEIEGAWEPARVVGGDYFDVIRLSENKVAICIADVVGKSISAALLMANVQATVRAFASDAESPSWLCTRVNSVLCNNIASGKFVTLFYGVLDGESGTLHYSNAGHLYPIVVSNSGKVRQLDDSGALLGVLPDWKYHDCAVRLESGDRLMLFTDGITEAAKSDGEEFGEDRVAGLGSRMASASTAELKQQLMTEVKAFCNSQLQDDATLVVVGRNRANE